MSPLRYEFADALGRLMIGSVVERTEQTTPAKTHTYTQEGTLGDTLYCEPTTSVCTKTVFREPKSLANVSNDVHDPPGIRKRMEAGN